MFNIFKKRKIKIVRFGSFVTKTDNYVYSDLGWFSSFKCPFDVKLDIIHQNIYKECYFINTNFKLDRGLKFDDDVFILFDGVCHYACCNLDLLGVLTCENPKNPSKKDIQSLLNYHKIPFKVVNK